MPDCFFRFEPMAVEIERKIDCMSVAPDVLFDALLGMARADGLGAADAGRLTELYETLCTAPFHKDREHPLNHPIRVAATWWSASERRDGETIALALCHNIRENGGSGADAIERNHLTTASREAIATLTIDRSRERDPAYLETYYDRIEAAPERLMVLKGYDKLDNFLSYALYDLDPYYFDVVDAYVTPRLSRISPDLAGYLQQVADYSRTNDAKARWRRTGQPA